ncbi:MAG: hypothetical protein WB586_21390 [Chthoniobacterales bacterium]
MMVCTARGLRPGSRVRSSPQTLVRLAVQFQQACAKTGTGYDLRNAGIANPRAMEGLSENHRLGQGWGATKERLLWRNGGADGPRETCDDNFRTMGVAEPGEDWDRLRVGSDLH